MKKPIFLFIFFCFFAVIVAGQKYIEMGSQIVTNYSPKEYGAYGQNWAVAQNSTGIMYFGNGGGLLEFDGASWELYEIPNKSSINSLAIAEDGKIFIGGIGEFGYFLPNEAGKLTYHSLVNDLPRDKREFWTVWQTFISNGKVWFFTNNCIFIWDDRNKNFKTILNENGFHVMFKVNDAFYVRERGVGIDRIKGDSLILIKGSEKFANEKVFVMLPIPGEEGTSLLVTRKMGLFKFNGERFEPFKSDVDKFIADNLIYAYGTVLSDKNILLGTLNDGAVVIDKSGKEIRRYNIENGIINNNIYATFQDRSGAIWLATDNGISRIDYTSPITYFDSRNKFTTIPYCITRYKGILYIAATTGAYYLDPITSDLHQLNNVELQSWAFLKSEKDLLLGTSGGLFKIENKKSIPIKRKKGSEYMINVMTLSNLNPNRIYLGADDGVYTKFKTTDTWIDEARILDNNDQKNSIIEDGEGTVWVGTLSSGIFRIMLKKDEKGNIITTNPVVEHYDEKNGLQSGQLSVDKFNGTKYFFSLDSIFKYDENKNLFYSDPADRLIADFYAFSGGKDVVLFQQDSSGRLWLAKKGKLAMGTLQSDGSYKWISAPFNRFADDEIYNIYQDKDNINWISTNAGIIKFDFGKLNSEETDFYTYIRNVKIGQDSTIFFGGKVDNMAVMEITFKNNSIKFRYSATSYEGKNVNKFKTFLDGFDKGWSSPTTATMKEYTNLPPGEYTFNVTGINILGVEGKTGTYSFEILPPWYRTWWAYGFYVLVLCFAIFIIDRILRRQLIRKERERAEFREAKLRAQTVELENKALQAENDRKLKDLEHAKEIEKANTLLEFQKEELQTTLENLKQTQSELIQSEKMAALGQLIAGIAHEINTPLGAIKASVGTITDSAQQTIKLLPDLVKTLSENDLKLFMELVNLSVTSTNILTSKEEREIRRKIATELEEKGIAKADDFADILVDIGIFNKIDNYLPLFKPQTMQTAYHLSMQIKNSQNIKMAVDRASKVVFALKNYARYGNEQNMVASNIVDGLETVLTLYQNQFKHGITLHKEFEEVPQIMCYPDELNQVWTNLIYNAIQSMEGKGEISIRIETYSPASLRVSITDTGKGIPSELKDRIFDAFFTTKAAGEGSGLGLHIVKQIIDKHRGKIWFESELGKGTSFFVELPIENTNFK